MVDTADVNEQDQNNNEEKIEKSRRLTPLQRKYEKCLCQIQEKIKFSQDYTNFPSKKSRLNYLKDLGKDINRNFENYLDENYRLRIADF